MIGAGLVLGGALATTLALRGADESTRTQPDPAREQTLATRSRGPAQGEGSLRWIVAAGGSIPELNQVQIEQDVALIAETFSAIGPGRVLFGAGVDSPSVQELAPTSTRDPVVASLADLFAPRGGRDARYRLPTIAVDEAATATSLARTIEHATSTRGAPLVLVLAGHGNRGETARDNTVDLWAQSSLTVAELAAMLDRAQREVRVVATTCFSGGFAELVFDGADPAAGPAGPVRCGLFATVWDLEAAGCDPNPDRAAQEGYALHFFNALRGRDRDGGALDPAVLDLDGDGAISLLEAHTRVRMVSEAADVPTTTSERWLRAVAPEQGPSLPVSLPEEDALIEALTQRLDLQNREPVAFAQLEALEDRIEAASGALEDAQAREDEAYRLAAAALLARWPVLDDPWHPDFGATVADARAAIAEHLETDPVHAAYRTARAEVDRRVQELAELRRRAAWLERLTRALDNRELAGRLHAAGGTNWQIYERLLTCERSLP